MQIFLYEYLCATGADLGTSLSCEGRAMLAAALADFGRIPGVRTVTLLHANAPWQPPGMLRRTLPEDEAAAFGELARVSEFTLVIAPEFDGLLETRARWVEEAEGRFLGSSPAAVCLAADKWELSRRLHHQRVPTPPCTLLPTAAEPGEPYRCGFPAVYKPRYGAGSQATFLVRDLDDLARCRRQAQAEGWHGPAILQPFVAGFAASVAFLVGPSRHVALPPTAQHLSADGRFHYQGGSMPLPPDLAARAVSLGARAIRCVSGLRGYVGADLVLGPVADGSADWVIEINPRLTTSYVGLRALAESNLAEAWLRTVGDEEVLGLRWREGTVQFQADGKVTRK